MSTKRLVAGKFRYRIQRANLLAEPWYGTFENEAAGDEYVARLEALLDRGIVPEELRGNKEIKKSLRDGVRRYLEDQHVTAEDKYMLHIITARLPQSLDLASMTFVWAVRWVSELKREQNLAPSTIRHHVGALARAVDWLSAMGDIPFNPLRLLKRGYASYTPADVDAVRETAGAEIADAQNRRSMEGNERDRRLEEGEEQAIRTIMDGAKPKGKQRPLELREKERIVLLFDMALESAMRMREMYTLSVGQIDLEKRTFFLDKTKNGSKRQVPISTVLLAALRPHVTGKPHNERLFPWWDGEVDREVLRGVTNLLSRQYARIFAAAGCANLKFHDLRHEATSRLYERTSLSDMEIAKITGHKSMAMLMRYSNLRGSTLAERMW